MHDICRLCLCVSTQVNCVSLDSEITSKIVDCLSTKIIHSDLLPNQVCDPCRKRVDEIYEFISKLQQNQKLLHSYLNKGADELKDFYSNLRNIKYEVNFSLTDDKENDQLNFDCHKCKVKDLDAFKEEETAYQLESTADYSSDDDLKLSAIKEQKNISDQEESVTKCKGNLRKVDKVKSTSKTVEKINTEDDNINFEFVKHKCLTCFSQFNSQNDLLNHYYDAHYAKTVSNTNTGYAELKNEHGVVTYKCDKCIRAYTTKREINRHVITHEENRPYLCNVCGRTYKTVSEIIRHDRAHNGTKKECSYHCGYSTVYAGALKEHEKRHNAEFKYKCDKCNKGFQVKTWYLQHQNIHNGVKPFVCDICGLAFHMSRYLTAHRSNVHPQTSNLKRYICVHCALPYDCRYALNVHLEQHGIKAKFLCDMCGKTVSSAEQLKYHRRRHLALRPYPCSICKKSFSKKCNLKLHEKTHTGLKEFTCYVCQKQYTQRSALHRHHARTHGAPKTCTKCKKQFTSHAALESHQKMCL